MPTLNRHHPHHSLRMLAGAILSALMLAACNPATPTPPPTATATSAPTATPAPNEQRYGIDPKTSIIDYMASGALGIQFPGTFSILGDEIKLIPDGDGYQIKVTVLIDGKSVTAVNDLVKGALTANLEVDKYPTATFIAAATTPIQLMAGTQQVIAKGELTLHGETRVIEMPIAVTISGDALDQIAIVGETKLDLLDYKVNVPTAILSSTITFKASLVARLVMVEATADATAEVGD